MQPTAETNTAYNSRFAWIIDPGHGRLQPGKRSPFFFVGFTRKQFEEWEFNRDVTKRLAAKLTAARIEHYITVPETEVGAALQLRVDRANAYKSPQGRTRVFLSIHANASTTTGWGRASGLETWYFHGSEPGRKMAGFFQQALTGALPTWKNRGTKSRPDQQFFVLRATRILAVLTESGFYDHPQEVQELIKPETRERIAEAHFQAILRAEKEF